MLNNTTDRTKTSPTTSKVIKQSPRQKNEAILFAAKLQSEDQKKPAHTAELKKLRQTQARLIGYHHKV